MDQERIDQLMSEGLIGMSEAAKHFGTFRGGRPTHFGTIIRWCKTGVKVTGRKEKLKLESLVIGERIMTTKPSILRFVSAQQPQSVPLGQPRTKRQQERATQAAIDELTKLGI